MQAASGGPSWGARFEWDLPTDLGVWGLIQSGSPALLGSGNGPGRVSDNRTPKAHITWFFEKGDGLT